MSDNQSSQISEVRISEVPLYFNMLQRDYLLSESNYGAIAFVTPHARRERGKVISVGVYIIYICKYQRVR